ncbi:MAG: acyltransferase [Acidimicrobiales bacterium]|nr:acyltransferase [Acidimicrobiales bacterium]HRW37223.1 acyltransferase [Aquihabitans sp.]
MTDPAAAPRWTDVTAERAAIENWHEAYLPEPTEAQRDRIAELNGRDGYHLHPRAYVADGARVIADRLTMGEHSTIASGCTIRGDIAIGAHTAFNAGSATIGKVTLGDGVRIASYAVLVGENHGIDDLELPIAIQPLQTEGIEVGDDVWIGANATIVDGVRVGSHSVIAAGAVVTGDVPEWAIVGGVPARVIRDRRDPKGERRRRPTLERYAAMVAEQWPAVLERCATTHEGEATYVDVPGHVWGPRPLNDAIEIAGAFGEVPSAAPRDELVARIQAMQDPATGMFVDPRVGPADDPLGFTEREWDLYGVLSCGYALDVLGAGPAHPIHAVEACGADELQRRLDELEWTWFAWPSGSWIDGFATAAHLNRRHHGSPRAHEVLWGWLAAHVDPASGMWGVRLAPEGGWDPRWLMAVNGWYRLVRGTYAQFDVPVPYPERALDTVLAHAWDHGWFEQEERNACNVLDIVHPLWLLGRQTDHRAAEVRDGAARILGAAVADWQDGRGMPWQVGRDEPGLQGTEMWLSIVRLAADALGESDGLPWTPRGVHRLEPADQLAGGPAPS